MGPPWRLSRIDFKLRRNADHFKLILKRYNSLRGIALLNFKITFFEDLVSYGKMIAKIDVQISFGLYSMVEFDSKTSQKIRPALYTGTIACHYSGDT